MIKLRCCSSATPSLRRCGCPAPPPRATSRSRRSFWAPWCRARPCCSSTGATFFRRQANPWQPNLCSPTLLLILLSQARRPDAAQPGPLRPKPLQTNLCSTTPCGPYAAQASPRHPPQPLSGAPTHRDLPPVSPSGSTLRYHPPVSPSGVPPRYHSPVSPSGVSSGICLRRTPHARASSPSCSRRFSAARPGCSLCSRADPPCA